ncbi:hypothetical protein [Amycolatopsis sp. lyj-108]|uniref:hypothetical protein n=1 Tax=Amycolatopsis sp. lyj-108 TaxID=2789286 RepID=UPI00397D3E12
MGEVFLLAGHPEVADGVVEVRADTADPAAESAVAHEHEPHVFARLLDRPAAVIVPAVHRRDGELRTGGEIDEGEHSPTLGGGSDSFRKDLQDPRIGSGQA